MKRIILILFFTLFALVNNAQNNSIKATVKSETILDGKARVDLSSQKDDNQKAAPIGNSDPVAEPNPTPEQQGYTKYTIDGKDYYYKEEGQLKINYDPKK